MKIIIHIGIVLAIIGWIILGYWLITDANANARKRDRIKVVHDHKMGCDYISINGGPFFPRLNSLGVPACDYPNYIRELSTTQE